MVVIEIAGGEAGQRLAVKRVGRGCAGLDDVALIELELYFAGDILLSGFHESTDGVAERREPFALVDNLCELVANVLLGLHGGPV